MNHRPQRTPHREALENAWNAARSAEHADTAAQYDARDFWVRIGTLWALIAQAEKQER